MADNKEHVPSNIKETKTQNGKFDADSLPKVLVSEPTSPVEDSNPLANGGMEKEHTAVIDESKTPEGNNFEIKLLTLFFSFSF
jgi:hypothetical protein